MSRSFPHVERIQTMRADLGPSAIERVFFAFHLAVVGAAGIAAFSIGVRDTRVTPRPNAAVPLIIGAVLFGLAGWLGLARLPKRYEVDRGILRCRGRRGRIVWEESLDGLLAVKLRWEFRGSGFTEFVWPTRRRFVPYTDWWRRELMDDNLRNDPPRLAPANLSSEVAIAPLQIVTAASGPREGA